MAAEIRKITEELRGNGHPLGAELLKNFTNSLEENGLIPSSLAESLALLWQMGPRETAEYLEQRGLEPRYVNALFRAGLSYSTIALTPDKVLSGQTRKLGPIGVKRIRAFIPFDENR